MKSPKVSVVIPAYNHERYVKAAVDSVLSQAGDDLELIVIDDGSTDRTGEIVKAIRDERLHYHRQTNQDAYNAINHGLRLARGDYLAILNSDDVYVPGRIARLVEESQRKGAQFVFTNVEPIDENGEAIHPGEHYWHIWHERNRQFLRECGDLYTAFLRGNLMVSTSNIFMTRRAYETVGGFAPLRYLHDYDYIFRMLLAFPERVLYLQDEVWLKYRIHRANTLSQGAVAAREEDLKVITKYMLAGIHESCRPRAEAGAERLRELERELAQVREQLKRAPRRWWQLAKQRAASLLGGRAR
jgi:glycosyltransferase involved in cell wall biosynthesis